MQPVVIQTERCAEHAELLRRIDHKLDKLLGGDPEGRFLTSRETARRLGVSESTLCNWRKSGRIAFHQQGRFIRYRESDVLLQMEALHIKPFAGKAA
jgi:excisionase family DNA binding protein